jgi:hypothetical protein
MYYSSYAEARRRLKNIKSPCCKLLKNLNKIKYQASTIGPSVVVKRSPNFWAKAQCEEQSFPNKHSDSRPKHNIITGKRCRSTKQGPVLASSLLRLFLPRGRVTHNNLIGFRNYKPYLTGQSWEKRGPQGQCDDARLLADTNRWACNCGPLLGLR